MFIQEVMAFIWQTVTDEYNRFYKLSEYINADRLYIELCNEIQKRKETLLVNLSENEIIRRLVTTGCSHCMNNGVFAGCSMCDFLSENVKVLAKISALRRKSEELYAKLIIYSLTPENELPMTPTLMENLTCFDMFDEFEMPMSVLSTIFEKNIVYSSKPFSFEFVARADNITKEKIELLRKYIGKRVIVKIGIEVSNEWIRNHWINKGITTAQVIKAVDLIHSVGWKVNAFLIIGIPGLTELQSLELFYHSYIDMLQLGFDRVQIAPLLRKERTMQGFIYRELINNEILYNAGLVNEGQTGWPHLLTVLYAIKRIWEEDESNLEKVIFTNQDFHYYFNIEEDIYGKRYSEEFKKIHEFIDTYQFEYLQKAIEAFEKNDVGSHFNNLLDKQVSAGDINQTLQLIAGEISKTIWKEGGDEKFDSFLNENLCI